MITPVREGRFGPVEVIAGEWSAEWREHRSCSLVVEAGRARAIIDPAASENRLAALVAGATVCIHSHPHPDHILYSPMFPHVPLYGPAADHPLYDPDSLSELGPDAEALVGARVSRRPGQVRRRPDRPLAPGDSVDVGGVEVRAVGLPGHTAGMLGYHFPAERLLYLADFDLRECGPWYGNASSDPDGFFEAAGHIESIDADRFVTSHEVGIVTPAQLRPLIRRFLGHIGRRDEVLLGVLRSGPRSLDALAQGGVAYSARAVAGSPWARLWERQHVRKHLVRLERAGAAAQTEQNLWMKR